MTQEQPDLEALSLELKKLGYRLMKLPAEFAIAKTNSVAVLAYASDLLELMALIEKLPAQERRAETPFVTSRTKGKKPLTAKSARRRRIRAHNHRARARSLKRSETEKT